MDFHVFILLSIILFLSSEFYFDYAVIRYLSGPIARKIEYTNEEASFDEKKIKKVIDAINKFGERETSSIEIRVSDCNDFNEFATKIMKFKDLFDPIYQESISLFEKIKSVKIDPRCFSTNDHTQGGICFKNTEVQNLENLKLTYIEFGRNDKLFKKTFNYSRISHKFDELFIIGTVESGEFNEDKFNISIRNGELQVMHDYTRPGFYNFNFSSLEDFSGTIANTYVTQAVKINLRYIYDMTFKLPVQGFYGLLNLLEDEISTPLLVYPNNMLYNCIIMERYDVSEFRKITFKTVNTTLFKQRKYNVFNKVMFSKKGDSYAIEFIVTFYNLVWTANFSTEIGNKLNVADCVKFIMKDLKLNVTYMPNSIPAYIVDVSVQEPIKMKTFPEMTYYLRYLYIFKKYFKNCFTKTITNSVKMSIKAITKDKSIIPRVAYRYVTP
ncbi:uncharacterized protein LOC112599197 [Melanaphis sacchari]|uniref:uncharacterized protein LOC112599197 n=1 Tax=Melanaphis sacchari TaxID=742174 RepID=UPI000DC14ADB|nr:uncharacterized protein LOC112599197 [Melanaphis sacchari]